MSLPDFDVGGPSMRRVPVDRNGVDSVVDLLLAQNVLLEEVLAELKRSNTADRTGAVSSVEIKDLASGKPQATTKVYAGSPVHDLVDEALEEHGRLHREAEANYLRGWQTTVDRLVSDIAGQTTVAS